MSKRVYPKPDWTCRICRTAGCSGPGEHRLIMPDLKFKDFR